MKPAKPRQDDPIRTAAFDRLYDLYAPRVMGYLWRLTRNRAEAEDLTQETFLAAYHSGELSGSRQGKRVLPFLFGIAWRRWRDGRRGDKPTEQLFEASGVAEGFADSVTHALVLEDALALLPPLERNALLLTAVQGMTYREAAQITREPAGTVKWRVHQATRKLRDLLTTEEADHEAIETGTIKGFGVAGAAPRPSPAPCRR